MARPVHDPACLWIRNAAATADDAGVSGRAAVSVPCTCGAVRGKKAKPKARGGSFEDFATTHAHMGDGNYTARRLRSDY